RNGQRRARDGGRGRARGGARVSVRSVGRRVLSLAPVLGLVARPEPRPDGIVVLDNGASSAAREAIDALAERLGSQLVRVECPALDLFEVSNLGLARA